MEWDPYQELLALPRPELRHQRMPRIKRAAQFAPFAALSGYEEMIAETIKRMEERQLAQDNAEDYDEL